MWSTASSSRLPVERFLERFSPFFESVYLAVYIPECTPTALTGHKLAVVNT